MAIMNKHLKLKIHGQVHGVGFRWCSYEKFVELGLTGKAENAKDGTVEIDVTGEDALLSQFVDWAKVGPSGAKVTNVEVSEVSDAPVAEQNNENDKSESVKS